MLQPSSKENPLGIEPPAMLVEPPIRGQGIFKAFEQLVLRFDRGLTRILPEHLNPFLQTGSLAVMMFLVALASGIILLIWYRPSVVQAYPSMQAMVEQWWFAGIWRSLHRYSSDACMFFAVVHMLRLFLERRFTGARWFAWITGITMLIVLWFLGWTGYWLVWDERAQHVATGSAAMLDLLPIFADPMGRSLFVNETVNSLLFFVVFFLHMMVPLAMGVVMWLHIARIARARFLTERPLTIWLCAMLLGLSLAYPATNADPAAMQEMGQSFSMDWWFLLPIWFTDRYDAGVLWLALIGGSVVLGVVPWIFGRGSARPAHVDAKKCNACEQCFNDCPYNAIEMVKRTEGNMKYETQAHVIADKCVGCGICAGSCDSVATGLPWFDTGEQRHRLEGWVEPAVARGESPGVAFVCSDSAGGTLSINTKTGRCDELPGFFVLEVPCAGWVHTLTAERLLRRGASCVLVTSCAHGGDARFREGYKWTQQRFDGERGPSLRTDKVDRESVTLLTYNRTQKQDFINAALAIHNEQQKPVTLEQPRALAGLVAACLAVAVAGVVGFVSDFSYATPTPEQSRLIVSFKHSGAVSEDCRELTAEEIAAIPVHMRTENKMDCARRRSDVRLRILIDGEPVLEKSYPPQGLWGDGTSIAMETLELDVGTHLVEVGVSDTADPEAWEYEGQKELEFTLKEHHVISFNSRDGFTWY